MVLEMNVDVFTRSLTEITLDPARKNRLRLMTELCDQGVSSRETYWVMDSPKFYLNVPRRIR